MQRTNGADELGRNVLCPTCGEKLKHCSGHRRRFRVRGRDILFMLIAAAIAAVAFSLRFSGDEDRDDTSAAEIESHRAMLTAYAQSKSPDTWWLHHVPQEHELELTVTSLEAAEAHARTLLTQYRDVSPLAREIADAFPTFFISIFTNGASMSVSRTGATVPPAGGLEICFIPHQEFRHGHPSLLYYRESWHAVMMAGISFPDSLRAAMLFHELGHALRHRAAGGGVAARSPATYAFEEVEMHTLGSLILNAASGGAYFRGVDSILDRVPQPIDARRAALAVTRSDLELLDRAIGCEQAGFAVSLITVAEHLTVVAFRAIDRTFRDEAVRREEKRSVYQWFADTFMAKGTK